jgi:hypothetical protein
MMFAPPLAAPMALPAAGPAETQEPGHRGFFLRLGFGAGFGFEKNSYDASPTISESVSGIGYRAEVLLGTAVTPGLVLGGGVAFSTLPGASFSATPLHPKLGGYVNDFAGVGFANFYFSPNGGFQVLLLGGVGSLKRELEGYYILRDGRGNIVETRSLGSQGYALVVGAGVGWDAYVSRNWSLGLMLNCTAYYGMGKMDAYAWRNVSLTSLSVLPTLGAIATYN